MSQKIKKIIHAYYYFFDTKLKNTTIIVGLIGMLILSVGIFLWWKYQWTQQYAKSNLLELKNNQVMTIWNSEYRISIDEIQN